MFIIDEINNFLLGFPNLMAALILVAYFYVIATIFDKIRTLFDLFGSWKKSLLSDIIAITTFFLPLTYFWAYFLTKQLIARSGSFIGFILLCGTVALLFFIRKDCINNNRHD